MRRSVIAGLLLLVAVGIYVAVTTRGLSSPPFVVEAQPLPEPTSADHRSAETATGTKYWPRSAPLEQAVAYRFNTGHCGLGWMPDFDGSFWVAHRPKGRVPSFFYNEEEGTIRLLSHARALYRSPSGGSALLIRHEGPLVVEGGCA